MLNKYSGELKSSNGHLSNAVMATYLILRENLSEKEISFIENHLSSCEHCNKRLNEMIEEDAEIDDLEGAELGDKDKRKFKKQNNNYYIWAAAAMLVIAVGMGIFYIFQEDGKIEYVQDEKDFADSLITEERPVESEIPEEDESFQVEKKEYDPSDFAANTILENFINRNVRSTGSAKIISPEAGDTLNLPLIFKWEGSREIKLEIVDNENKTVATETLSGGNFTYSGELNRGLYYWKILVDNKLQTVGKFFIK
jgi:hypothetical protein